MVKIIDLPLIYLLLGILWVKDAERWFLPKTITLRMFLWIQDKCWPQWLVEFCTSPNQAHSITTEWERTRALGSPWESSSTEGWEEEAPFAGIIVTAASFEIPPPFIEQLEVGGRIVIPLGGVLSQVPGLNPRTAGSSEAGAHPFAHWTLAADWRFN